MHTCRHAYMSKRMQNERMRSDSIHPRGSAIIQFMLYVSHKDRHTQTIRGGIV